jgi:hypothetical protein
VPSNSEEVRVVVTGRDETGEAFRSVRRGLGDIGEAAGGPSGSSGVGLAMGGIGAAATAAAGVAVLAIGTIGAALFDISGKAADARLALQGLDDVNLEGVLSDASLIATRYGEDQQKVFSATRTLMDEFGLSSEEATDLLLAGFDKGLDLSGDFLDSVGEYSNLFADNGYAAEEFFSIMESGQLGGTLGTDKAADAIKEFGIRLLEVSDDALDQWENIGGAIAESMDVADGGYATGEEGFAALEQMAARLGTTVPEHIRSAMIDGHTVIDEEGNAMWQQMDLSAAFGNTLYDGVRSGAIIAADAQALALDGLRNMQSPVYQNTAGVALFGTMWEDMGASAMLALDSTTTSMADLDAASDASRQRFDTLGEVGPRLWSEFTIALLPASDALLAMANEYAPQLFAAMGILSEWVTQAVAGFNLFIGALSGTGQGGGVLSGIITAAQPILDKLSAWATTTATWFTTSLMPALSGAGSTVATMLMPHIQTLSDFATTTLMPAIESVAQWIGDNLPGAIAVVTPLLSALVDVYLTAVATYLRTVASVWSTYLLPAFTAMGQWLGTVTGGWDNTRRGIQAVIDILNRVKNKIAELMSVELPSWLTEGISMPSFEMPSLPGFAGGVTNFGGGAAIVGERGPELVTLPRGSNVIPAARTAAMMGRGSGGMAVNVTVNAPISGGIDSPQRGAEVAAMISQQVQAAVAEELSRAVDGIILGGGMR